MTVRSVIDTSVAAGFPIVREFVGSARFDGLVKGLSSGLADVVGGLLAPFEMCLDFLGSSGVERLAALMGLQARLSDAEAELFRVELLGKDFRSAVRFGWRFTGVDGTRVESRSISRTVAEVEAVRMVDLFAEASPGVGCECVVLDYAGDSVNGVIVGRTVLNGETGGRS